MGLRLARNLGPVSHLTPGQWTAETASGLPAICCPKCSGVSDLEHRVLTGGVVSMVWACSGEGCSYVDFISLEAWGELVVPA